MATLAQKLSNPGLRSKLAAKYLSPAQRKERARLARVKAANANPLYDPSAILSGAALQRAASQITDAQLTPQIQAQRNAAASATTQGTALMGRAADYYKQIANQELQGLAQQRALGAALQRDTQAVGDRAQAGLGAIGQQEADRYKADQDVRGAPPGGANAPGGVSDRLATEIAALRGRAGTVQQGAETHAAQASDRWSNLANALGQSAGLRGQEIQQELGNRLANEQLKARQNISTLEANRGNTLAQNLLNLRQQGFTNIATRAGLDIKNADIQAQLKGIQSRAHQAGLNRQNQADIAAANRTSRENIANAQINAANARAALAKAAKGTKEPASALTLKTAINNLAVEYGGLLKGQAKGSPGRAAAILRSNAKKAKQSLPPIVLNAAADIANFGYVLPHHLPPLEQAGIQIPADWYTRPKPRPKPKRRK